MPMLSLPLRALSRIRVANVALPILLALVAVPAAAAPCTGFVDVDAASPFCAHVTWIKNRGITLGCTPNQYCPDDAVTRLQMAAFMNRLGNVTFQQGGNAYGQTAVVGSTDNQAVDILANGKRSCATSRTQTGSVRISSAGMQ